MFTSCRKTQILFMIINTKTNIPHWYDGQHSPTWRMARHPVLISQCWSIQIKPGGRHLHVSHGSSVGIGSPSLYTTWSTVQAINHKLFIQSKCEQKKIEKLKSIAIKEITYQFHWQCRKMLFSNVKMDNNQCLIIVFFNHYIDSWFEKRSIYSRIWLIKIDNVMINKTNRYQWPIENCILILIRKKT